MCTDGRVAEWQAGKSMPAIVSERAVLFSEPGSEFNTALFGKGLACASRQARFDSRFADTFFALCFCLAHNLSWKKLSVILQETQLLNGYFSITYGIPFATIKTKNRSFRTDFVTDRFRDRQKKRYTDHTYTWC